MGDPRYLELLKGMIELHQLKARDYGTDADPLANLRASEEFGIPAWLGCLIRLNDKVSRLKTYARKRSLVNESVDDNLIDLAAYSLLTLILIREERANQKEKSDA